MPIGAGLRLIMVAPGELDVEVDGSHEAQAPERAELVREVGRRIVELDRLGAQDVDRDVALEDPVVEEDSLTIFHEKVLEGSPNEGDVHPGQDGVGLQLVVHMDDPIGVQDEAELGRGRVPLGVNGGWTEEHG